MNSSQKAAGALEDVKIPVKLKLSALWAATLFLYAYGDIFGFFRPDVIESVKAGKIAGFQINQVFLLAVSIYILIPSAMVFLALVLKPEVNRWANLIVSVAYFATIVLSAIGETWAYYVFLSLAESVLTLLIAWHAWKWPQQQVSAL
ncbi:MAG: hypothetical protein E6I07_09115 [Chloroflexi bacterium]|nr:MAG: hypothetical protein E6I07_09115 [Chloroflexota bacterium]